MSKGNMPDVLVLGAGPAGMAIASALGKEKLDVEVLSPNGPDEPWPNTLMVFGVKKLINLDFRIYLNIDGRIL